RIKLYEIIIERYRDYIEKSETKTIADLKLLVRPNDEVIQKKKEDIIECMRPYIYEQHFQKAAEMAHKFVREIRTYTTTVNFWLTPKEMMNLRGGDPMDKAVFLCSLLVALENPESYVIVGMNKGIKVAVGCSFNNEFIIMDPISPATAKGEKDKIINEWFKNDKKIYDFNDRDYFEIKSEE
ncbi:MAG: hypothetical protein QW112_03760, partial [Candidatus Micrarchaeia archaeon]